MRRSSRIGGLRRTVPLLWGFSTAGAGWTASEGPEPGEEGPLADVQPMVADQAAAEASAGGAGHPVARSDRLSYNVF